MSVEQTKVCRQEKPSFNDFLKFPFSSDSVKEEMIGEYIMDQKRGVDFGYIESKYKDVRSFDDFEIIEQAGRKGLKLSFSLKKTDRGIMYIYSILDSCGVEVGVGNSFKIPDEENSSLSFYRNGKQVNFISLALVEALINYIERHYEITAEQMKDWASGGARERVISKPKNYIQKRYARMLDHNERVLLDLIGENKFLHGFFHLNREFEESYLEEYINADLKIDDFAHNRHVSFAKGFYSCLNMLNKKGMIEKFLAIYYHKEIDKDDMSFKLYKELRHLKESHRPIIINEIENLKKLEKKIDTAQKIGTQ